jgi:uncharacterized membrane protein
MSSSPSVPSEIDRRRRSTHLPPELGSKIWHVVGTIDARAHWIYLIYAVPMLVFLTFGTPPFQVPDENAHFLRAEQISHGGLVGFRLSVSKEWSGGLVDPAIETALAFYVPIMQHSDVKLSGQANRQAREVGWTGKLQEIPFPNTVNYGPLLYFPQAIGIRLAKQLGLSVIETMQIVRLVDSLGALFLSFVALKLCRHGRAAMFTTLLLPMTLFQFAGISQDAWIISLSMLFIGLASHLIDSGRPARFLEYILLISILCATSMVRPPTAWLACLLFLLPFEKQENQLLLGWMQRVAVAGVAVLLTVAWFWGVSVYTFVDLTPWRGISAAKQVSYLFDDPRRVLWIGYHTIASMGSFEYESIVGVLGWLDTYLPTYYYSVALATFAFSVMADLAGDSLLSKRGSLLALATIAVFGACLYGIQYVSWSPVGSPVVEGYQGRYVLGFLPLLGWLCLGFRSRAHLRVLRFGWVVVALFPVITLAQLPLTIIKRYYLWP